jgi:hypothetical protein
VNANNPADGVTSITATAPLTGGTITSTGSIGLDQTALSITRSQVSDFTSGTVAQAGTATYAVNSGTAIFSDTSGTAVSVSGSAITQSQVIDLVSDLAGKANLTGGNAFTGAQTITGTASGSQVLTLTGAAGQTADILRAPGGARIPAAGNYFIAPGLTSTFVADFNAGSTTTTPVTISGLSGQTANLLRLNVAGTDVATIGSAGQIRTAASLRNIAMNDVVAQLSLQAASSSSPVAILRGAASQSADLLQVQDSAASNLVYVNSGGGLFATQGIRATNVANLATSANSRMSMGNGGAVVDTSVAGNIPLQVQNINASPTGDLTRWLSTASAVLARITSTGGVMVGTQVTGTTAGLGQLRTSSDTGSNYIDTTANDNAGTGPGYTARRARGTVASPTQVQANDLLFGIFAQGWNDAGAFSGNSVAIRMLANQNFTTTALGSSIVFETASDGTTGRVERMRVTGAGTLSVGTTSSLGQLGVQTSSASTLGLVVRGASAQTADLFLLQNNGGTTQFRVDPNGMTIANSLGVAGSPSGISYAYFTTPSASAKPVVVRGAASQTANLQEWQNSAGTVMGRINADGSVMFGNGNMSVSTVGSIFANAISTNVGRINMGEANSGGQLTITRQTAAATNPGANIARLYLRDGTDAGTLKLVVRAGASGAETTILDNIPQ